MGFDLLGTIFRLGRNLSSLCLYQINMELGSPWVAKMINLAMQRTPVEILIYFTYGVLSTFSAHSDFFCLYHPTLQIIPALG